MKKTNLFIVGAPKCATSSVFHYLKWHPETCMVPEPEYFCKDFHKESDKFHKRRLFYKCRKEEGYLRLFSRCKNKEIFGEKSAIYLYSSVSAKEIYKFNNNAKLIILIRDPIEFLQSWHSHLVFMGHENIKNFENALEKEDERKRGINIPRDVKQPSFLYYSEISKFSKQIKRYLRLFNRDQIKMILFDDLKNEPEKIYNELLEFLGLDKSFVPKFKHYNPNKINRSELIYSFLKNRNSKIKNAIKLLLPDKINKLLWKFIVSINQKKIKRRGISPVLYVKLRKRYYNEVKELSKLLNRNLIELWGYD